jgi:hypothetical protein
VDRRAEAVRLSRAAYLRELLLAGADACAVLRSALADRDELIARLEEEARKAERCFGLRLAGLEAELERARLASARASGWERSDVAERRRQAHSLFYG